MDVLDNSVNSLSDSGSVDIETCNGSLPADSPLPAEEMTSVADSLDGGVRAVSGVKAADPESVAVAAVASASASGIRHLYTIEAILGLNSNGNSTRPLIGC